MKGKFLDPMSFLAKCVAGQGGGGVWLRSFFLFPLKMLLPIYGTYNHAMHG